MMQLDLMAAPSARRFAAYHRPGGNPNSAEMRRHEINHPHLTVTTYTRAIKPSDVLGDIAARLGELSTYGMDRVSRR